MKNSNRQLMEVVLPRLARPLYRHLRRYRSGKLNEEQFTERFDSLLRNNHDWLTSKGIPAVRAALAIHGAVLVLSGPGLRAEAKSANVPLEVIEYKATKEAAADVARNFNLDERKAFQVIARIVARYAD
jgi:hypothetical protein